MVGKRGKVCWGVGKVVAHNRRVKQGLRYEALAHALRHRTELEGSKVEQTKCSEMELLARSFTECQGRNAAEWSEAKTFVPDVE